jgi:hypothetical protein
MGDHAAMAIALIQSLKTSLKTQTGTWFVGAVIAILGIFSDKITESIKFALNRADLRTKQYEELAADVSSHLFSAELTTEFIENNWTTKQAMTDLLKDYNASITTLRRKEFVYLSWLEKYWGCGKVAAFQSLMQVVGEFDLSLHSLNDEFEAVNITGSKPKVDELRTADATKRLKPTVVELRKQVHQFLTALE